MNSQQGHFLHPEESGLAKDPTAVKSCRILTLRLQVHSKSQQQVFTKRFTEAAMNVEVFKVLFSVFTLFFKTSIKV